MKRIFITGTARSGTTLLQSIIGSHSEVATFPETHFFSKTIPKQNILRLKKIINNRDKNFIKNYFNNIEKEHLFYDYYGSPLNLNKWTQYLIELLDSLALDESKNIWTEKTPLHLYYTDLIKKSASNVIFVHILRNPVDNITSLYHVGKKHPDSFAQNTLEKAFSRYKKEATLIDKKSKKKNNFLVYYEDITSDTENTIKSLCSNIDINFSNEMMNHAETAKNISLKDESWKSDNQKEIKRKSKTKERLSKEEYNWLTDKVSELKIPALKRYDK